MLDFLLGRWRRRILSLCLLKQLQKSCAGCYFSQRHEVERGRFLGARTARRNRDRERSSMRNTSPLSQDCPSRLFSLRLVERINVLRQFSLFSKRGGREKMCVPAVHRMCRQLEVHSVGAAVKKHQ